MKKHNHGVLVWVGGSHPEVGRMELCRMDGMMYEAGMAVQTCKDPHKLFSDNVFRSRAFKSKA